MQTTTESPRPPHARAGRPATPVDRVAAAGRGTARRTGLAYLGIIATGIFAEFAVRGSLVEADDAIATAGNIAESPGLFGVGIGADVMMVIFDAAVAIGLFRLLRNVDRRLATIAAGLRLVQGAVIGLNLANLLAALGFAQDATAVDGTVAPAAARDALDAVERHALGYDAGLIAFGLSCLVLARLLRMAGAHRLLAIGMAATGVVYLAGSTAAFLAPGLSSVIEPFYAIALVSELSLALVLLVRGRLTSMTSATPAAAPPRSADRSNGDLIGERR